jgi:hypothetical protein
MGGGAPHFLPVRARPSLASRPMSCASITRTEIPHSIEARSTAPALVNAMPLCKTYDSHWFIAALHEVKDEKLMNFSIEDGAMNEILVQPSVPGTPKR